jgi:hypothetical protein
VASLFAHADLNKNKRSENTKLNAIGSVMPVAHGQISMLNMTPTKEEKEVAQMMSEAWTSQWLAQHGNEIAEVELRAFGYNFEINLDDARADMATAAAYFRDDELKAAIGDGESAAGDPNSVDQKYLDAFKLVCQDEYTKRHPEYAERQGGIPQVGTPNVSGNGISNESGSGNA